MHTYCNNSIIAHNNNNNIIIIATSGTVSSWILILKYLAGHSSTDNDDMHMPTKESHIDDSYWTEMIYYNNEEL